MYLVSATLIQKLSSVCRKFVRKNVVFYIIFIEKRIIKS
jgi:hypothetical protein